MGEGLSILKKSYLSVFGEGVGGFIVSSRFLCHFLLLSARLHQIIPEILVHAHTHTGMHGRHPDALTPGGSPPTLPVCVTGSGWEGREATWRRPH